MVLSDHHCVCAKRMKAGRLDRWEGPHTDSWANGLLRVIPQCDRRPAPREPVERFGEGRFQARFDLRVGRPARQQIQDRGEEDVVQRAGGEACSLSRAFCLRSSFL